MIQLVFAQSTTSRDKGELTQKLRFGILVKNLAYEKQITVHWAGVDNKWHQLPAFFSCQSGGGREQWYAETVHNSSVTEHLPGAISFVLQYSVSGMDYWDNNQNSNYFLSTDTGLALGANILLSLIDYNALLPQSEIMQIVVASHWSLQAQCVFVRWTTDNWKTYYQTLCTSKGNNSIHRTQKVEPDSGSNQISLWTGRVRTRKAFKVEYAIGCVTENGEIWDNNFGCNYISSHNSFKLLTLNLHCYQEQDQDAKFTEITRAISEIDIDIICLQEVGEVRNDTGQGEWRTNAARIIRNRLRERGRYYHLYKDWSHIGFNRYQEGSAILSKYPFLRRKAAYVSTSKDINSIHARKIVMAQIYVPAIGSVNVFSVHLSWWSEGFRHQFEALRRWADEEASVQVAATLLCGDFNIKAGSQGYMLIVDDKVYEDQFLRATSPALFAEIFKGTLPNQEMYWADDDRIDYIYANKNASLHPIRSRAIFSGRYYRRVSDHVGYLTEFEPEEMYKS